MEEIKDKKLYPCPFCGERAELIIMDDTIFKDLYPSGKGVRCNNNDCWIEGNVIDYNAWQSFER